MQSNKEYELQHLKYFCNQNLNNLLLFTQTNSYLIG